MGAKHPTEVEVGDIIVFGVPHRVDRIDPPTPDSLPKTIGYARSDDGWGITLLDSPGYELEVV